MDHELNDPSLKRFGLASGGENRQSIVETRLSEFGPTSKLRKNTTGNENVLKLPNARRCENDPESLDTVSYSGWDSRVGACFAEVHSSENHFKTKVRPLLRR
jgi:hypothetical protein